MEEKPGPLRGMNATVYDSNESSYQMIRIVLFTYVLLFAFLFALLGFSNYRTKMNRTRKQKLGSLSV
jgi:hypothetical protein